MTVEQPPSARPFERFVAAVFSCALVLICVFTIPWRLEPIGWIVGFLHANVIVLGTSETLTALLALWRARITGDLRMALLAAAYAFSAPLIVGNVLTLPGVAGYAGNPQTASWTFLFWHVGWGILIAAFVWTPSRRVNMPALPPLLGFAAACLLFAVAAFAPLPALVRSDGSFEPLQVIGYAIALSWYAIAFAGLARRLPRLGTMDLWIGVALVALTTDQVISIFGVTRYSLGFYVERALVTFSGVVVLLALFSIFASLIRRGDFVELLERRVRERTAELEELNRQLADASRFKTRFIATMSHELRTPLNAIIGFTGTVLMKLPGPLTDEQERQLRIVQSSASHLLSLINDVLELSKVESGKIDVQYETIDLNGIVEEVAAALRGLAEQKGLRFELKTCDGSLTASCDRRILQQILTNLVSNGIKYTESGFVRIELSERHDEWIDFSIVDSGVGIDSEHQVRIFEAFERIDNSITRRTVGSGLGLHLSHRFATMIGGRLAVKSAPGAGSTFTLSRPH